MEDKNETMLQLTEVSAEENFKIMNFSKLYGTGRMFVTVRFTIPSLGRKVDAVIPVDEITSKGFRDYIPTGFVMKTVKMKEQVEFIRNAIYEQLQHPQNMKTLLPQGFYKLNAHWVYVVGNLIINKADTDDVIPYNPEQINLRDLTGMSADVKKDWGSWCKTFLGQSPDKAALFLCALTSYLRPLTEHFQLHAKSVNAFVTGTTGCGKTSFCKLLSVLPDGRNAGVNLGSDRSVLYHELENYANYPVLIDDLNLSSSTRELDKKLQSLSELIQTSSSGGVMVVKGTEVKLGSTSLLITGEYLPSANSTINRCVVVRFERSFPTEALNELQTNQKQYRWFLIKFIGWLLRNEIPLTKKIKDKLMNGKFEYRGARENEEHYAGYQRIMASARLLMITEYLLMGFLSEMKVFADNKELKKINKNLEKGVSGAIADTLDCVCLQQALSETLDGIRRIFLEDPDEIVAQNFMEYYNSEVPDEKLIFRYHDRVYFRGKKLIPYLEVKYGCMIAANKFSEELRKANLLIPRGKESTGKLPPELMDVDQNDKKCTARYYCLSIPELVDFLLSRHPNFLEYSGSPLRDFFFKK